MYPYGICSRPIYIYIYLYGMCFVLNERSGPSNARDHLLPKGKQNCWNTEGIRQQNVVLTNLGLRLFRIVVKVMMRATVGRVKMEDG